MKPKHLVTIVILLALVFPATPARAGGVVTTCDEAHLLAAVSGGGMVTFICSGTILLSSTITIAANTTIDGSGQAVTIDGNDAVRVFTVSEGVMLNLNKLTVTGGYCVECDGGGIYNDNGIVIVTDSIFSGNAATYTGGGISNEGTLIITTSSFSDNIAAYGGGIYHYGGTLTITGSTFSRNEAFNGGGIASLGTDTITNSTFTGNSAAYGGGITNGGSLTISSSNFSGNTALLFDPNGNGGGIYNFGTLTITSSILSSNRTIRGGGIFNDVGSTVSLTDSTLSGNIAQEGGGISNEGIITITSSTLSGNTAQYYGGGIISGGDLTITNSTLSSNTAPEGFGGGIYNYSTAAITYSTFSSNSAFDGGGIYNEDSVEGSTVRLGNTIVAYSPSGGNCHGTITDQDGNVSFPDATCLGIQEDPLLGPLLDNGGISRTHALLPGSTAIDAGSEALCPDLDQRGVPRPVDGDLDGEATCDIGAFEYQYHPLRLFLPLVQRVP